MEERIRINTRKAPAAFGPFSQAIQGNALIFTSGQLPLDPETGNLVPGDIQAQTRQVMRNLQAILTAAGSSFEQVVKATVFITNMDDFPTVNDVYSEFFDTEPPARSCVEVSRLAKGAQVEIDMIAVRGTAT